MSTGEKEGFIEIIQNSKTLDAIGTSFAQDLTGGDADPIDPYDAWFYSNNVDILNSRRIDEPMLDKQGTIRPPRRNALSGPSSRIVLSGFQVGDKVLYMNLYDFKIVAINNLDSGTRYSIRDEYGTTLDVEADTLHVKDVILPMPTGLEPSNSYAIGLNGYDVAKDNFAKSLAAYSVAAYVLGISDRTGENIMISRTGELFHIDFGCYFRNLKSRFGTTASKTPGGILFHPVLVNILGPEGNILFNRFINTAANAFRILRNNAALLLTMLSLMIGCGIPELSSHGDILHVRDNLMLDKAEDRAVEKLKEIFIFSLRKCAKK
jgi:hypothetical protein